MRTVLRHLSTPFLVVLLMAATAWWAGAQQYRDPGQPRRPTTGTASLTGTVLSADSGRPVARARVTASMRASAAGQAGTAAEMSGTAVTTLTDVSGSFVLSGLPAGTYTVTAAKAGFLAVSWGARRPQRPGKGIVLAEGQEARGIDLRLPRGGVLTGHVYDDGGEPIVRATVQSLRYQYLQGEPRLVSAGSAQTDDRGQFRIFGLAPGSYVVTAAARMEGAGDGGGRQADPSLAQSYAPTYYPGVAASADAVPIALAAQQEVGSVDFVLQAVPAARVSGVVTGEGVTGGGAMLVLVTDDPRGVTAGSSYSGRVQDDGSFSISGVPPGRYLAIARTSVGGGRSPQPSVARPVLVGIQPVVVAGQDVTGVAIALSAGATITGWVTFESAAGQRADYNQLRLVTMPPVPLPFVGSQTARVQGDGSFTISNVVAGSHLLRLNSPPRGWELKGIFSNGRDVSDQVLDVKAGQTLGGLQVVLTDRITTLTGKVTDASSEAVTDCYVVAFSTDTTAWRPRSRMVMGSRTDQSGGFRFTGLPPGDYYVAVVDDLEPGSWYDPALLGELGKTATRVSVEEGDTKTVALKYSASPSTEN